MKKKLVPIIITLMYLISFEASAQRTNIHTDKDGVTQCYSKPTVLVLNLLEHIQVEYRLVSLTRKGNKPEFAIVVISNYSNSKVAAGNNVMFRLSNGEVIKGVAREAFGDNDRVSAQNATSQAANQFYLQAYYYLKQKDLEKLMTGTIIKVRIEFENFNVDLDEKKCKTMADGLRKKFAEIQSAVKTNSSEF